MVKWFDRRITFASPAMQRTRRREIQNNVVPFESRKKNLKDNGRIERLFRLLLLFTVAFAEVTVGIFCILCKPASRKPCPSSPDPTLGGL